jgi:hypothetical protein
MLQRAVMSPYLFLALRQQLRRFYSIHRTEHMNQTACTHAYGVDVTISVVP